MKKYLQISLSVSLLVGLLMVVSCKDDDVPPTPGELSFAITNITVNEADDIIEIEVTLDKPALEDFTVDYEVDGTATEQFDFEILEDLNDYGEIDFDKGETTGIIQIQLYSDLGFEDDETIIIELTDVDSDLVEITRDDEVEITIEQEDGLLILLTWDYPDVDLDLFLWAEDDLGDLVLTSVNSSLINFTGPEFLFLPTALDDGTFGLSCIYYEGTADPMDFAVNFVKIEDGVDVSTTERLGSYGLVNINEWDNSTTGTDPVLVVTFEKSGTDFTNFSDIETPVSGSRVIGSKVPSGIQRTKEAVMTKGFKKQ